MRKFLYASMLGILLMSLLAPTETSVGIAYFDANSDGVIQTSEFQTALNSSFDVVYGEPGSTYTVGNLKIPPNKKWRGQGCEIKIAPGTPYDGTYFFQTANTTRKYAEVVSIACTAGSSTFTYTGSNVSVGNYVELNGPTYYTAGTGQNYNYGTYGRVLSISGTTYTLDIKHAASFTASKMSVYTAVDNVEISNTKFNLSGRTDGFGIRIGHGSNNIIENCTIIGTLPQPANGIKVGIELAGSYNSAIRNKVYGMQYNNFGYGIAHSGHHNRTMFNTLWGNRHSLASASRAKIDQYNGNYYDTIRNSGLSASSQAADMHANDWHSMIWGCYIEIGGYANTGIQLRGRYDSSMYNKIIFNNSGTQYLYGHSLFENCYYDVVQYNTYINVGAVVGTNRWVGSSASMMFGTPVGSSFTDNVVSTASSYAAPSWLYMSNNTMEGTIVMPGTDTLVVTPPVDTIVVVPPKTRRPNWNRHHIGQ